MRYFLDAEFNGFGGELISLALVPEQDGLPPFYEAIRCDAPTDWVAENVIPVLETRPLGREEVAQRAVETPGEHHPLPLLRDQGEGAVDVEDGIRIGLPDPTLGLGGGQRPERLRLRPDQVDDAGDGVVHTVDPGEWGRRVGRPRIAARSTRQM